MNLAFLDLFFALGSWVENGGLGDIGDTNRGFVDDIPFDPIMPGSMRVSSGKDNQWDRRQEMFQDVFGDRIATVPIKVCFIQNRLRDVGRMFNVVETGTVARHHQIVKFPCWVHRQFVPTDKWVFVPVVRLIVRRPFDVPEEKFFAIRENPFILILG